jgi:ABC-type dipeptide/oligopeptide/nickel transport system ATPase component
MPLLQLRDRALQEVRRKMQIVFQDPFSSCDPRMSVGLSVAEGLYFLPRRRQARVAELLEMVGLSPEQARRYPHEFSCAFAPRCPLADIRCRDAPLPLREVRPRHHVACYRAEQAAALAGSGIAQAEPAQEEVGHA